MRVEFWKQYETTQNRKLKLSGNCRIAQVLNNFKNKMKKIFLYSLLILIVLSISTCGRKDALSPNSQPEIRITSSYGIDSLEFDEDIYPISFQQKIFWQANDLDGTVEHYAFRVLDENENPILGTPDHDFTDSLGWVYHYQLGADENIPMNDPSAKLTVWTEQVYALINFPANVDGDSAVVTGIFEVKCKDNRGLESEPARKYFNVKSLQPAVTGSSSKGDISGKTVGLGIILEFMMLDEDPYVDPVADYFEFQLIKRDLENQVIPEPDYEEWISTKGQEDINRFYLTPNSTPSLIPNSYIENEPADSTFLIFRAIDKAGIISEPDTISFLVKDNFYPETLIYIKDIFVLGENHFVTQRDASLGKIIPLIQTSSGYKYSTPFWIDKDGNFKVLCSNDLKIYLHWGWHGEFEEDDPFAKREGNLLDGEIHQNYFSEVQYFDLRLDNEPYYYPPFPPQDVNLVIDNDGTEWLRVPKNYDIDQETVLANLDYGTHSFEVRVVDLQGHFDLTPAVLDFEIMEKVPEDEKQGILIIDDSNNLDFDAIIDSLYLEFVSDYDGIVDEIKRKEIKDLIDGLGLGTVHFNKSVLSPTDLQGYKFIIFHSDILTDDSNFYKEYDPLNLYLELGGNLIFSCGNSILLSQDLCTEQEIPIFEKFFGLPLEDNIFNTVTNIETEASFFDLQFFDKALAENSFENNINLELPSFHVWVTLKQGLGPVAYFENFTDDSEVIFRYGCKFPEIGTDFEEWDDIDDNDQFPSESQYNEFNGKPVALKKIMENSCCYIFGFPLSFMNPDEVRNMMNSILTELD